MYRFFVSLLCVLFLWVGVAAAVDRHDAFTVADNWLRYNRVDKGIDSVEPIVYKGVQVGYVVRMLPDGFILVPNTVSLSPIKLWVRHGSYKPEGPVMDVIEELYVRKLLEDKLKEESKALAEVKQPAWSWLMGGSVLGAAGELKDVIKEPLVTTHWNQNWPYNKYAPKVDTSSAWLNGHAPLGCFQVATAQIMKFYRCPITGQGSYSYSWHGQILSADFNHEYDWNSMPDNEGTDLVAKTIYEVAIALHTDFRATGSPIQSCDRLKNALINYFKYENTLHWVSCKYDYHGSMDAFFDAIKAERDAGRVVEMFIHRYTGPLNYGHAVVVDGYREISSNGSLLKQVHINMGWGGYCDGYYSLDNIRAGGNDFSNWLYASALINIIPTERQPGGESGSGGGCVLNPDVDNSIGSMLLILLVAGVLGIRIFVKKGY